MVAPSTCPRRPLLRRPSPKCLQNSGRVVRIAVDTSERTESDKRSGFKPLAPEVARHHQLGIYTSLGFDTRRPPHTPHPAIFRTCSRHDQPQILVNPESLARRRVTICAAGLYVGLAGCLY